VLLAVIQQLKMFLIEAKKSGSKGIQSHNLCDTGANAYHKELNH